MEPKKDTPSDTANVVQLTAVVRGHALFVRSALHQCSISLSQRSASSAAMQPVPAAVTACR